MGLANCFGSRHRGAVWTVWYFTKVPCTTTAAADGVCNPGVVARFIGVEILLKTGGAALAVGALKGGYDRYIMRNMLNQEREARHLAEQQLAEQQKRNDENFARLIELREETLRQATAEREENSRVLTEMINELREERRQSAATQQALLDTIFRLMEQRTGQSEDSHGN